MHFIVSWDTKAQGERQSEINSALKGCLKGYSWVRPLVAFYIVKVDSQKDWDSIFECLTNVARQYKREANFVLSPLMEGGRYNGWLPKNLWPAIRKRSG